MRSLRLMLIAPAIVLAAACGSSAKSSGSSPTTTLSSSTTVPKERAAYLAAGNALCTTMNAKVAKLANPGSSAAKEAAVTDQAAKIFADTFNKVRKLPTPPGDEATVRALYAKIDAMLADAPSLSAALRANDQAAGQRAQVQLQKDTELANAASNAYGLTVCGS